MSREEPYPNALAVIAMAGRFPEAEKPPGEPGGEVRLERFWRLLASGAEAVRAFSDDELRAAGVDEESLGDPRYVRSGVVLDDPELFDPAFFGMSPREAALLDPQQRLFLECAWEALEMAGYDAERFDGPIGVYAGATVNTYALHHLSSRRLAAADGFETVLASGNDFLATRVSYKLGLRGPSMTVQTACSTSLVAVHQACQSLLVGECDMALAGGASIRIPQTAGYLYRPGGTLSPDGRCRPFDAAAGGSIIGSGVGVVVVRRLEDALEAGDPIRAVVRGSAVNNDGAARISFTAPGLDGQAEVIAEALAVAGVEPEEVSYVEAHGSGTPLGDPIEIAALTHAFRAGTEARAFCAVGSVKGNVGHLDAAAGVAGLIKTVLALEHRELPPSLHLKTPNPEIDFASSPFFVNAELRPWPSGGAPRRAGVSSFGMGGTNAHVVLEEAPERPPSGASRPWQLLLLSALTPAALEDATDRLASHLERTPAPPLPDVAHTLQVGRAVFGHRRALVCRDLDDARRALRERSPERLMDGVEERRERPVAFLFPGLGDHYPDMARGLWEGEPTFRAAFEECSRLFESLLERDLCRLLFPERAAAQAEADGLDLKALLRRDGRDPGSDAGELSRPRYLQPALFATEYALAKLWIEWGAVPDALFGYSLGEYVAACLAGVFRLEDAARIVALRARWIDQLPEGAMLAAALSEEEAAALAGGEVGLAAVNGPRLSVLAGPAAAIGALEARLGERGVAASRLAAGRAFHCEAMRPVARPLADLLAEIELRPPRIPFVSNVTGTWISPEAARDPSYWAEHLVRTVRFADGVRELWSEPRRVLLEIGPGHNLSSLALQLAGTAGSAGGRVALPTLRASYERRDDSAFLAGALGRLWLAGGAVDWQGFYRRERRRRVVLPTYPFERKRCWLEDAPPAGGPAAEAAGDAGALGTTSHARPGLSTPYTAPRGAVEERLAGIWQELLGVRPVGVHDVFFDLGGHSLLASQLVSRLDGAFGVEIPLAAVFEANTVAKLARLLDRPPDGAAPPAAADVLPRREDPSRAPMSYAQQRLWFVEQLVPGNSAYNNPAVVRLEGTLVPAALDAGLDAIVRRHEVLRTTFGVEAGEPVQRIHVPAPWPLPRVDLEAVPGRRDEARRLAGRLVRRPFDLEAGPVARAVLIRLGDEEHLFAAVLHHIVSDEWSLAIFVRELAALYEAFAGGRAPLLPELPVQYGDFAAWQRARLTGELLEEQIGFWRSRLEGAPPLLALPYDRPRPTLQSFRGASRRLSFDRDPGRDLAALGGAEGATLFMTLLAGFAALLGRYSGQDDLVLSSGTGNRPRVETEGLIGCFINVVLLRLGLGGNPGFRALLRRVRSVVLESFAHQETPFEMLVEHLGAERDLSRNPLTQVMLVFLNVPRSTIELPGLKLESLPVERASAQLDLTLYMGEDGGRLGGHLEYSTELFDEPTIERLLRHFERLLVAAAADPDRGVGDLPLLCEAERAELAAVNRTAHAFPSGACLHDLVNARISAAPDAVAVVAGPRVMTYGGLGEEAVTLRRRLARLGVGTETRVGIALERSPELLAALLGVTGAGAAYVPLDLSHPAERVAFLLEDAAVRVVVTRRRLAGRLPATGAATLCVDDGAADGGDPDAPAAVDPENLAYLIYTSGSTGLPKGVAIRHRGVVNNLVDLNDSLGVGPEDRVLLLSSLSFDMSVYETFGMLAAGGTVVVPEPERSREPAHWAELLGRHRITVWNSAPSLLGLLTDHLERRPNPDGLVLDLAILGGDWIPVGQPARLRALAGGLDFIALGGATEASIHSIVFRVTDVDPAWRSIPYGRPMRNQRAYLLDRRLHPVPPGVPGELWLGGAGLARGYAARAALTAERFLADPLAETPGERLYRTGDLARWLPGGVLELLGRLDFQVKIRGVRVELGEIEAAVREHPDVAQAVVAAPEVAPGDRRLTAYVVAAAGVAEELRRFLEERLPETLVPSYIVPLEDLPLTVNGKVDRRRLPAPEARPERLEKLYVAPRTRVEEVLAAIWEEVLRVDTVGVADDFFDLGGHSLLATQVVTRLEEAFALDVPLRRIFDHPTVETLAVRLEETACEAGLDLEPVAQVFLEISRLSDEEVAAMLAARGETAAPP